MSDDARVAIGFSVTLSTQLISAALAILAIEGAYVVFVLDKRSLTVSFAATTFFSAAAFVASIFVGGKGITASRDAGLGGNWSTAPGRSQYNWQAGLCLVGLVCLMLSLALTGPERQTLQTRELGELKNAIDRIGAQLDEVAKGQKVMVQHLNDAAKTPAVELRPVLDSLAGEHQALLGLVRDVKKTIDDRSPRSHTPAASRP